MKFTKGEMQSLHKYCQADLIKNYEGIVGRMGENTVKIVNTGMVSSGKSSLYNVLIDSVEQEHFPTGAARTTQSADSYTYKDITFIDTPGIDVRTEDDALAFETMMKADMILMVHNIKTGPLNRSEVEWLENIAGRMPDEEMRRSKIIFVCTWKDTRENDADYEELIQNVKHMVFESVGTEVPFFEVSVKKYLAGRKANGKAVLVEKSGINELKDYIEKYVPEYLSKKQQMDREELHKVLRQLRADLYEKCSKKDNERNRIYKNVQDKYRSKKSAWQQVFDYFSSKRTGLLNAEKELNSI